jgi:hypothetical protein
MPKKTPKKLDPPPQSVGGFAHSAARAIIGMVPGGSVALEFFNNVKAPPLEKRRQKWMNEVAAAIRNLEQKSELSRSKTYKVTSPSSAR